jgi:hypothetical protein
MSMTTLPFQTVAPSGTSDAVPQWDNIRRRLHFRGDCIKAYTGPAQNQEVVLAIFQTRGWPSCVDSPWHGKKGGKWKKTLENTMQRLNEHRHSPNLRFHVDGKGRQIRWEEIL